MTELFAKLRQKQYLRALERDAFAGEAAAFLATLNAIHPFREGNGRTQASFLVLLAARAGHPLDLDRLDPEAFLAAMVRSFSGDERPLAAQILQLAR
jgi:cell filamentation protein, protein adenylyltransferase